MFTILSEEEKELLYPDLFKGVFGFDPLYIPEVVAVQWKDQKAVGFVSGQTTHGNRFFIHWAGKTNGDIRGSFKLWILFEKFLADSGVQIITTQVVNINTHVLRFLMKLGWIIYGTHIEERLYIDLYKNLEEK